MMNASSVSLLFAGTVLVAGARSLSAGLPEKDRHVILVSIDGFPARLWHDTSRPLPNLRKLAAEGAQARAMTVSNPSVTWINHTTLITGVNPRKHGVLFNGMLTRPGAGLPPKVEQWADKTRYVLAPTLYDLAHAAGLTTAEVNWPATTRAPTLTWSFAELPDPEDRLVREMIADGALTPEQVRWMHPGPKRQNAKILDATFTRAAQFAFAKHRPHLLMYHTFNTDHMHHIHGPGSPEGDDALSFADELVGALVRTVEGTGLRDQTTFIVTTDHGFKSITRIVLPNVVLKKAGHAQTSGNSITTCEAAALAQGGICFIYVTDPAQKADLLPRLKELFAKTEGVDRVLDGNEGPGLGMPTPAENQGMGDLILYPKAGYAFKSDATGEAEVVPTVNYGGTHGYLNSDPELDGFLIANGCGIKPGVTLDRIAIVDVAPTIAKLLGIALPDADGRVLSELLAK